MFKFRDSGDPFVPFSLFWCYCWIVWGLCKTSMIMLIIDSNFVLLIPIRVNLWLKIRLLVSICYMMNWWRKHEYLMWYILDLYSLMWNLMFIYVNRYMDFFLHELGENWDTDLFPRRKCGKRVSAVMTGIILDDGQTVISLRKKMYHRLMTGISERDG